jgi:hypothetical protein
VTRAPCSESARATAAAAGHDEDLVELPMHEAALQREALDLRSARGAITAPEVADPCPAGDHEYENRCERERTPHRRRAYRR